MCKARALVWTCVLLGFITGVVLSVAPPSWASRNSSGTYSLPTGNPVVTATSITSTWANTTLADIKTEITSSLDRAGRGAMTAPLQHSGGSLALPSVTFSSQTSSGLYLAAASDVRMSIAASPAQTWAATGTTFPLACTVTGLITGAAGEVLTQSTANGSAITATGNGTGKGGVFTGGSTDGTAITATGGASNGKGIVVVTTGTGDGLQITAGRNGIVATSGGATGVGIDATGAGSGSGGYFTGGTTGAGVTAAAGTAATGGTRKDALVLTNGDVDMSGVTNPTSTTAISERLTPMNLPKAWATITVAGSNSQSVLAGFNIASIACGSNAIQITFATAFANSYYSIAVSGQSTVRHFSWYPVSATRADIYMTTATTGVAVDLCGVTTADFSIIAFGAQ